jgi:hypothetical protein
MKHALLPFLVLSIVDTVLHEQFTDKGRAFTCFGNRATDYGLRRISNTRYQCPHDGCGVELVIKQDEGGRNFLVSENKTHSGHDLPKSVELKIKKRYALFACEMFWKALRMLSVLNPTLLPHNSL